MDKLIHKLMKSGKDINDILDMPIHYVVQLMQDKNKPREEKSLIAAFGG
ncbi:phage tail assembly chaperone GT [Radiobacillus sp. PE A8.2]